MVGTWFSQLFYKRLVLAGLHNCHGKTTQFFKTFHNYIKRYYTLRLNNIIIHPNCLNFYYRNMLKFRVVFSKGIKYHYDLCTHRTLYYYLVVVISKLGSHLGWGRRYTSVQVNEDSSGFETFESGISLGGYESKYELTDSL